MQELAWLGEVIGLWLRGASWAEIKAAPGFFLLVMLSAALIPSTFIALGIDGWTDWRRTPLAIWFGVSSDDPDADWALRARDLDKDGAPDI